jgi:AcrR family transcriptional regulator
MRTRNRNDRLTAGDRQSVHDWLTTAAALSRDRRSRGAAPITTSTRRTRELEEREQALLAAATALMDRDDWEAVTVEDIARRAEYAKGTVYRHFASKDDLHARLVADWTAGTAAALETLDADRPFEAVLRNVVAVAWQRLTADRVHARLFQHVERADFLARLTPASRAALTEADARILGLVAALVDWGIAEGAIPRAPLEPRLFAVTALLVGALRLHPLWAGAAEIPGGIPGGIPDPERTTADAILALLRAV